MYITINSIKKTLGKYIELNDLYIGIPMIMIFLSLSKKNRMYKVLGLFFKYIFKCKNYIYTKER